MDWRLCCRIACTHKPQVLQVWAERWWEGRHVVQELEPSAVAGASYYFTGKGIVPYMYMYISCRNKLFTKL